MKKITMLLVFCWVSSFVLHAQMQDVERVVSPNIATPQLFRYGNQQALPLLTLNGNDRLALEFDDLEGGVKNYYYTFVLCDYDWTPVNLSPFEYIKGFTQNRISTYRNSSYSLVRYTHYQAVLPENGTTITKSGNYLLKVFLDGDTSKLVFTKRMFVVEVNTAVLAQVVQPFTPKYYATHQRLKFSVTTQDINAFSMAQQVKAVILQNNRWDNAIMNIPPTFVRGRNLEFDMENQGLFAAGKEWRWLDLRSFRLQSDRVDSAHYNKNSTEIFLRPDIDRTGQRYAYFPDYNGMYNISTYETINPFWQGDYATVHFNFVPQGGKPFTNQDLYLAGGFTDFDYSDKWKMKFNENSGRYEISAYLKQGYYNYTYTVIDKTDPSIRQELEGNYWETENLYTILIYYKSFSDRYTRLIGMGSVNSRTDKPGISF